MGSESDCLFGQLDRILWTSDSEAGVKTEKSGGVAGGVGECVDDVVGLLVRDRRSLDILPVKKEVTTVTSAAGSISIRSNCYGWADMVPKTNAQFTPPA